MGWELSTFLMPLIHKEACKAGQDESLTSSMFVAWELGLSRAQ